MRTRAAAADDAPAIAALITSAYRVEAFFVDGDRTNAADVLNRMQRGRFLLLEDESGLAGCVYVEARDRLGYFGMLSVDPARQRQGLGGLLVGAAEDWCREHGCAAIEIEVVNLRSELPPYYRRLGYREHGARPFPDEGRRKLPCHFIVMTKSLQA